MWDKILELAIGDGLWALLFCVLLIYELKDSRAREGKYQNVISSLAKDLEYLKDIDEDIEQMNNAVKEYMDSIGEFVCQKDTTNQKGDPPIETAKECA